MVWFKGWVKRSQNFGQGKEIIKGTCPNMFWLYSLLASFAGSISEPPFKSNSTVSNALSRFTVYWYGDYFKNIKKYSSQKLVKKNTNNTIYMNSKISIDFFFDEGQSKYKRQEKGTTVLMLLKWTLPFVV